MSKPTKAREEERDRQIAAATAWLDARDVTLETPEEAFTFASREEALEAEDLLYEARRALIERETEAYNVYKHRQQRSNLNPQRPGSVYGHSKTSSVHYTKEQVDEAFAAHLAALRAAQAFQKRSKHARAAAEKACEQ